MTMKCGWVDSAIGKYIIDIHIRDDHMLDVSSPAKAASCSLNTLGAQDLLLTSRQQ